MNNVCRELREGLARGPGESAPAHAEVHLATCLACRQHVEAHDRLLAVLRTEPAEVDDVTRARWLAVMSPQLDAIAAARHRPRAWLPRGLAMAVAGCAVLAIVIGWTLVRDRAAVVPGRVGIPAVATLDREVLRPYVFSGRPEDEHAATNFLAGRFSSFDLARGQLVRATFDHDRDQRIAAVGPAHVAVVSATKPLVALEAEGTLLVDARSVASLRIHASHFTILADHATFAVQTVSDSLVLFVDRGEVAVGPLTVHTGEWFGPDELRTALLVTMLREHASAVAPPAGRTGLLAVEGSESVFTRSGSAIGTAPLWARLDASELALVVGGPQARPQTVMISDTAVTRIVAPPAATRADAGAGSSRGGRVGPSPRVEAALPGPEQDIERESAAHLYGRAEAALRLGDRAGAEAIWSSLVAEYPQAPLAATALYDLANLTRVRDRKVAQAYLTRLLDADPSAALRELAQHLTCRLHVEDGALEPAAACFTAFRASFPGSSHDGEILAWLIGRAQETGGCPAARTQAMEYLRKYPHGDFAARAATCGGAP